MALEIDKVEVGDKILAKDWNQLEALIRATRLSAGRGVRLLVTPSGTSISFDPSGVDFGHPHKCTLISSKEVRITAGQINTLFPTVDGEVQEKPVTLRFDKEYDANDTAWIAAKVYFDDKWQVVKWEYVHTIKPFTTKSGPGVGGLDTLADGTVNVPIAVLVNGDSLKLYQHAYFNLTVRTRPEGASSGHARHLYFAT